MRRGFALRQSVRYMLQHTPRATCGVSCAISNRSAGTLSHVSSDGTRPKMVDVADKRVTKRLAKASAIVSLPRDTFQPHLTTIGEGADSSTGGKGQVDIVGKKGAVFNTAIIAGVMGAKNTSTLLPFCHPLPLESCDISIGVVDESPESESSDRLLVEINTSVSCTHKTGVEMEALTAASCAALCIYDMCKALSHDIVISDISLTHKSGGKSLYTAANSTATARGAGAPTSIGADHSVTGVDLLEGCSLTNHKGLGVGESIRHLLKIAGVDFVDERLDHDAGQEAAANSPWGDLPTLRLRDGKTVLGSSRSMCRLVAKVAGSCTLEMLPCCVGALL